MWTAEFGEVVLKEYRHVGRRIYLRGRDRHGNTHIHTLDLPPFIEADWKGEMQWKDS